MVVELTGVGTLPWCDTCMWRSAHPKNCSHDRSAWNLRKLCHCVYKVHNASRKPVLKRGLDSYQAEIDDLLRRAVLLCKPCLPSECASIKYHWPRYWPQTRREMDARLWRRGWIGSLVKRTGRKISFSRIPKETRR